MEARVYDQDRPLQYRCSFSSRRWPVSDGFCMAVLPANRSISWFTLLLAGALALFATLLLGLDYGKAPAWVAALTVFSTILAGKLVKTLVLGLAVAAVLLVHPESRRLLAGEGPLQLAQAWLLTSFLFSLAAVHELYAASLSWRRWLLWLAGLILAGGFAWHHDPLTGLVAVLGMFVSLLLAWATLYRNGARSEAGYQRSLPAILITLLGPLGAAALAVMLHRMSGETREFLPFGQSLDFSLVRDLWANQLSRAFWVPWWLTVIGLLWGGWRTIRRGARGSQAGKAPVSWALGVFSLLAFLAFGFIRPASVVALLPWCTFLLLFLPLDLVHGVSERLVLEPPEEKKL